MGSVVPLYEISSCHRSHNRKPCNQRHRAYKTIVLSLAVQQLYFGLAGTNYLAAQYNLFVCLLDKTDYKNQLLNKLLNHLRASDALKNSEFGINPYITQILLGQKTIFFQKNSDKSTKQGDLGE